MTEKLTMIGWIVEKKFRLHAGRDSNLKHRTGCL